MFVSLMLLLAIETSPFTLKSSLTLEAVPEDAETFLQGPRDIAIDDKGRILVLDLTSKRIFVWDRNGKYLQTVGREGQGPGEFNFRASMGGMQGYISAVNGQIQVYDGGNRVINIYDEDLNFVESKRFNIPNGRAEQFRIMNDGRYLVFNSSYTAEEPFRQIAIYQPDASVDHTFIKSPDQTWRYTNNRNNVVLHIYSPSLFMHYDSAQDRIIIGNSAKPSFAVYGTDGTLKQEFELKIPRLEVTDADIEEFESQEWIQRSTFFKTEYPEEKSFYDQIYPVGDRGFLVFNESPVKRNCLGYWVNMKGEIRGRFTLEPGEGGRLLATDGRLFAVTTDTYGDYSIAEVKPDNL